MIGSPFRSRHLGRLFGVRIFLAGTASWLVAAAAWQPFNVGRAEQPGVSIAAPGVVTSENFFEYSGSSWSLVGPRGFVRFGPAHPLSPGVPGFENAFPGLGAAWSSGNVRGEFYGYWSQGVTRSLVTQTPQVVVPSGSWGVVGDQSVTPFVIGFFPVVGHWYQSPMTTPAEVFRKSSNPLVSDWGPFISGGVRPRQPAAKGHSEIATEEKKAAGLAQVQAEGGGGDPVDAPVPDQSESSLVLRGADYNERAGSASVSGIGQSGANSTAERVTLSVAEAKRQYEEELAQQAELVADYLKRAEAALSSGKIEIARIYVRLAARRDTGAQKPAILKLLEEIERRSKQGL